MATQQLQVHETTYVVIYGTIEAGKASVANALTGLELFNVKTPVEIFSSEPQVRKKEAKFDNHTYKICLVDKNNDMEVLSAELDRLAALESKNILVLFVVNCQKVTKEDCKALTSAYKLVKEKFSVHHRTQLIMTGRDLQDKSECSKKVMDKFEDVSTADALSANGVLCVTLPKLSDIVECLIPEYQKQIEESKDELRTLLMNPSKSVMVTTDESEAKTFNAKLNSTCKQNEPRRLRTVSDASQLPLISPDDTVCKFQSGYGAADTCVGHKGSGDPEACQTASNTCTQGRRLTWKDCCVRCFCYFCTMSSTNKQNCNDLRSKIV